MVTARCGCRRESVCRYHSVSEQGSSQEFTIGEQSGSGERKCRRGVQEQNPGWSEDWGQAKPAEARDKYIADTWNTRKTKQYTWVSLCIGPQYWSVENCTHHDVWYAPIFGVPISVRPCWAYSFSWVSAVCVSWTIMMLWNAMMSDNWFLLFVCLILDVGLYSKLVRSKLDGLIERSACACVSVTLS